MVPSLRRRRARFEVIHLIIDMTRFYYLTPIWQKNYDETFNTLMRLTNEVLGIHMGNGLPINLLHKIEETVPHIAPTNPCPAVLCSGNF